MCLFRGLTAQAGGLNVLLQVDGAHGVHQAGGLNEVLQLRGEGGRGGGGLPKEELTLLPHHLDLLLQLVQIRFLLLRKRERERESEAKTETGKSLLH